MHLIFDSHLDLAWNAVTWNRDLLSDVSAINALEEGMKDEKFRSRATTTFPEMRRARVAVCLGTMMGRVPYGSPEVHGTTLDYPTHQQVFGFACGQMGYYEALEQSGDVRLIRTSIELNSVWGDWTKDPGNTPFGLILAMEGADAIMQRWIDEERLDFWEGRTTPEQLWRSLFPGDSPAMLTAALERSYGPGPLYEYVASTTRRMWLLSNHRSGWLLPRLVRFGLGDRFERVLVSDVLAAAKPGPRAFDPLCRAAKSASVCLVDDSAANVDAARAVGLDAHLVVPTRPITSSTGTGTSPRPWPAVPVATTPRRGPRPNDPTPTLTGGPT